MENETKQTSSINIPEIQLPKGGGALKGIGETFQPSSFSGTGSYSIPMPITKARGFEPQLSLDYNSGNGNSPFGIGFSLSLPKISIRTEKGIPTYQGKDVFIAGVGELAPKLKTSIPQQRQLLSDGIPSKDRRVFFINKTLS